MGLLWAFLLNAALALSIEASSLGTRILSLNRNTDTADGGGEEDIGIVKAFSTFYVVYSTFRVFTIFGSTVGIIAWESLDDFPKARLYAVKATRQW